MSLFRRIEAFESCIVSVASQREIHCCVKGRKLRRSFHTTKSCQYSTTASSIPSLDPKTTDYEDGTSHHIQERECVFGDESDRYASDGSLLITWPRARKVVPRQGQDIWQNKGLTTRAQDEKFCKDSNLDLWQSFHEPHPLIQHEGAYPPQPYNAEAWPDCQRHADEEIPEVAKTTSSNSQTLLRKHKSLRRMYRLVGVTMPRLDDSAFDAAGALDIVHVPSTELRKKAPKEIDINIIQEALAKKDPHGLLYVLLRTIHFGRDEPILASLPPQIFTEILRQLHPKHFIRRYGTLHREVNSYEWAQLGLPTREMHDYHRFCRRFLHQMTNILRSRSEKRLSSEDYRYLLKCCRETGNARLADKFWHDLVAGREPLDVTCFNDYLAAKCWTEQTNPDQRQRLRIIPGNTAPRYWKVPPPSHKGHVLGGAGAIKNTVTRVFHQMVEAGVSGNEETFCLMIIALARSGDLAGVGSILKRIWGIDVEGIWTKNESELPFPKQYSTTSAFYPSEELLVAVTHAYGINNSIPIALRIVDYISRNYNVNISSRVWRDLLEHTFELSRRRSAEKLEKMGLTDAQLPLEAVSNLWSTMTSPPYNVKPNMAMYNLVVKNCFLRGRYGEVKRFMEEGRALHHKLISDLQLHIIAARRSSKHGSTPGAFTKSQRDLAYHYLRVRRSRLYIRHWVLLWIKEGSASLKKNDMFGTTDLPRFILVWKSFLPHKIKYRLISGSVEFVTDSRAANRKSRNRLEGMTKRYMEE